MDINVKGHDFKSNFTQLYIQFYDPYNRRACCSDNDAMMLHHERRHHEYLWNKRNVYFTSHLNGKWNGISTLKTDSSTPIISTLMIFRLLKSAFGHLNFICYFSVFASGNFIFFYFYCRHENKISVDFIFFIHFIIIITCVYGWLLLNKQLQSIYFTIYYILIISYAFKFDLNIDENWDEWKFGHHFHLWEKIIFFLLLSHQDRD